MPVQFRDYYETLGVSKTATSDDIRKAFRKLARQYHPDVAKDKKTAEEKFKQINEAYEVLSDTSKREKYDRLGADWQQYGTGAGGGGFPGGGAAGVPAARAADGAGRRAARNTISVARVTAISSSNSSAARVAGAARRGFPAAGARGSISLTNRPPPNAARTWRRTFR